MKPTDAWLLDLYPAADQMVLWFITEADERLRLTQSFAPVFHVDGVETELSPAQQRAFYKTLERSKTFEALGPGTQRDFWTDQPRPVLGIRVRNLDRFKIDLMALSDRFPMLTYYNCDILPEVLYCYATGLFPAARCRIVHDGGTLEAVELHDDPMATDYALPPLRQATIEAEGNFWGKRPRLRSLSVEFEGRTTTWDEGDGGEMLDSFRRHLEAIDPDIIWTQGGDTYLMRVLFQIAQARKAPLGLDRDENTTRRLDYNGKTYVSYGQVLYHAPDYPLFGRLHFDTDNSVWVGNCGLEGLVEISRMAKIPLQRAARRSIGTGISSIQLDWAYRRGYLIPWRKSQHEAWKSAWQFIHADRGGLVFQPLTGTYEDVWELDFVSMFPSIMVNENVSPETVNCSCCPPSPDVPELNYTLCRRRKGLTAHTLAPIIEKRVYFKSRRAQAKAGQDTDAYQLWDNRQGALKWLLVCCFGYLGYRNARFGRIEAHESTCAFSREKLLAAKAICEDQGFEVLHAIVDSFWIRKPGSTREEIERLTREINQRTNLTIAIEGRYAWLVFLPSRQDPELPVPNRYFGVFEDGSLKFRGIETRRGDQAAFVRRFQRQLLDALSTADSLAACREMKAELIELVNEAENALRRREAPLESLFLSRKTSKEAEEYKNNSLTAVAARQAKQAGLDLHAGEAIVFLVTHQGDQDPDSRLRIASLLGPEDSYDVDYYVEQLHRAAATVLERLIGESFGTAGEEKKKRAERKKEERERRETIGAEKNRTEQLRFL